MTIAPDALDEIEAALRARGYADTSNATTAQHHRERGPLDVTDDEAARLLATIRTGDWLDAQTFPDLRWHVEGLIPEGYSLLVGPPKLGKSWMVLGLGLAIAAGGRALGHLQVERRPVLYLALEDGDRRLQDRSRKLLGPGGRIPAAFEYVTRLRPDDAMPLVEAWLGQHADAAPLVMVDTLGKVMPPALSGETTYQRDYRIGSTLKRLVDDVPGSAILVNHHDRKAGAEDFVEAVSGTNGLAGAADSVLVLNRRRMADTGTLRITGRDVDEAEYALTFRRDEAWKLDGSTLAEAADNARQRHDTEGISDRSAEIFAFVAGHATGVQAKDVEKAMGADARRYLARLEKSGRLVRLARGLYGVSQVSQCPNVPTSEWDNGTDGTQVDAEAMVLDSFPGAEPGAHR